VTDSVLFQAFIYLAVAVLFVPIAKRLGLGSVLGYLLAGVAIGPFGLHLVGEHGEHVKDFAEFGVVMMLFLVGLELKPSLLWELRRPIFGMGGLQVVGSTVVLAGLAMAAGVSWKVSLAIGMTLAMSSTAIVLQSLGEKGLLKTAGGQASFSVLLFQDLSVIPILAAFPLLALAPAQAKVEAEVGRPGWLQALFVLGAVATIVVAGRYVVRPIFRVLASTRLREVFTAFALFLVVGIALLMTKVGLSPALGTFLAGVVLAESEYRHELESDIEPFKGLLLGLFFISVGAEIDFALMVDAPLRLTAMILGTMTAKMVVLYALARIFKLDASARWLFALGLCQVGEFAFVLIKFGTDNGVWDQSIAGPLVATTALTMLLTPIVFIGLERYILPRLAVGAPKREADEIKDEDAPVVLAGFGRVGQVIGRMLRVNGIGVTVLDLDPSMVDLLRRLGSKVHYGDASRLDLLTAAGCAKAKLFVLAIDDVEKSIEVAELVMRNFPHLQILARARNRQHYYRLRRLGITAIHRETMGTSLDMGAAALMTMGMRAHTAHRLARIWKEHDERNIEKMGTLFGKDQKAFFAEAKKLIDSAENAMREEQNAAQIAERDAGWDNESLREEIQARARANAPPQPPTGSA
jgi:monovalent cation:proton antiporter-2 (CPA2) family protein